jgi:glycosyltransferase involved in cell wall biosynthesis
MACTPATVALRLRRTNRRVGRKSRDGAVTDGDFRAKDRESIMTNERISAVICTRNRGADARAAVESVLTNNHPAFRLIVVDQSTNDETERSLADLVAAGRIDYVRTTTVGLSRARNIGLRHARTRVVAFTDDDCETPDDWLQAIQTIFDE